MGHFRRLVHRSHVVLGTFGCVDVVGAALNPCLGRRLPPARQRVVWIVFVLYLRTVSKLILMSLNLFLRRTHIYLALFLLPWFGMYGLSSLPFSHPEWFKDSEERRQRTVRFDRPYQISAPLTSDLRELGKRILLDNGLHGSFGVYQPNPQRLNVYLFSFWSATEITYFIDQKRLLAEDQSFRWSSFLTGLHARGGFEQESLLNDSWGVVVDFVCLGFLVWIGTGLYMWWQLQSARFWGGLALGGGILAFLVFVWSL